MRRTHLCDISLFVRTPTCSRAAKIAQSIHMLVVVTGTNSCRLHTNLGDKLISQVTGVEYSTLGLFEGIGLKEAWLV